MMTIFVPRNRKTEEKLRLTQMAFNVKTSILKVSFFLGRETKTFPLWLCLLNLIEF